MDEHLEKYHSFFLSDLFLGLSSDSDQTMIKAMFFRRQN
jgi:hypothetical protein